MPRLSPRDGASSSFTWTTVFYLLLVLIAPLAFFGTPANAEVSEQEDYGSVIGIDLGTTYSYVSLLLGWSEYPR
jgi:heat shock protein 5